MEEEAADANYLQPRLTDTDEHFSMSNSSDRFDTELRKSQKAQKIIISDRLVGRKQDLIEAEVAQDVYNTVCKEVNQKINVGSARMKGQ